MLKPLAQKAVLRIHDILGWIRIRIWIRESMPLTNGSGSGCGFGSCYFRHWPSQDANKMQFFQKVFLLVTFWRYTYIIFKDKKSKRSHKAVGIKVFLYFFLLGDRRIEIRIRIHTSDWWIRIQEVQKHVDPVDPNPDSDPDPQHCQKVNSVPDPKPDADP